MPQILVGICSLLFIGTYLFFGFDLLLATKILVYSSAIALVTLLLFFRQQTKKNQWLILGATVIFGTLTIVFGDGDFIKWRTTLVNVVIGLTLLGMFYLKKSPAQMLFEKHLDITVPQKEWLRTNIWWAAYMFFMAGLNSIIVLFLPSNETWMGFTSDNIWMTFKMIINPAMTFCFMAGVLVYLSKKSNLYKAQLAKQAIDGEKEQN